MSTDAESAGSPDTARFFEAFGRRVRELRKAVGYTQADMASFGFSVRHWQQIETGRPIAVKTLLRISKAFKIKLDDLVRGLEHDQY